VSKSEHFSLKTFLILCPTHVRWTEDVFIGKDPLRRSFHCTPWGGRRVTDTCACDVISLGQQRLIIMMKDSGYYNHADLCKRAQSW